MSDITMSTIMNTIDKIVARMREHEHALQVLQAQVVQYARQQAEIEQHYDTLLLQAHQIIEWLRQLQVGDVIGDEWIAKRDRLIEETYRLLPQGESESIWP